MSNTNSNIIVLRVISKAGMTPPPVSHRKICLGRSRIEIPANSKFSELKAEVGAHTHQLNVCSLVIV